VDGLVLATLGILVIVVGGVLLAGYLHPGSGADVLDWKPTRSAELETELEVQEMDDMLVATNRRRAKRGLPPLTEADLEARVVADQKAIDEYSAAYRASLRDSGAEPRG
jgi:hypothetical protein